MTARKGLTIKGSSKPKPAPSAKKAVNTIIRARKGKSKGKK